MSASHGIATLPSFSYQCPLPLFCRCSLCVCLASQQSFGFDDQEVGYIVVILGFGVILSQAFLLKPLIAKFQERGAIIFSIFCGLVRCVCSPVDRRGLPALRRPSASDLRRASGG